MTLDPRTLSSELGDLLISIAAGRTFKAGEILRPKSFIESMIPLHDAWLAAKPPCPTCGGTKLVRGLPPKVWVDCPNCPDGVQPFDRWTVGLVARDGLRCRLCGHRDHAPHAECQGLPPGATWAGLVALWTAVQELPPEVYEPLSSHLRRIDGTR